MLVRLIMLFPHDNSLVLSIFFGKYVKYLSVLWILDVLTIILECLIPGAVGCPDLKVEAMSTLTDLDRSVVFPWLNGLRNFIEEEDLGIIFSSRSCLNDQILTSCNSDDSLALETWYDSKWSVDIESVVFIELSSSWFWRQLVLIDDVPELRSFSVALPHNYILIFQIFATSNIYHISKQVNDSSIAVIELLIKIVAVGLCKMEVLCLSFTLDFDWFILEYLWSNGMGIWIIEEQLSVSLVI